MNKYMHLIEGKPAKFDGEMISFVCDGVRLDELLVDSLAQIRREQRASREYRERLAMCWMDYDYLRVKVNP